MGAIHTNATIRNPAQPDRIWEGHFLVDAGATDTLVPGDCLEAIGIEPEAQRVYVLADGREPRMDITDGRIEFMGEIVGCTIVFAEEGTEPLLGVTALESAGIEVDPNNQQLTKLPSVRLVGFRPAR